ncbi:MAG: hypothetical protein R3303_05675 [Marinobacter sp.]|nr:hypothetical protein [Marinobacter sp.]
MAIPGLPGGISGGAGGLTGPSSTATGGRSDGAIGGSNYTFEAPASVKAAAWSQPIVVGGLVLGGLFIISRMRGM